MYIQKYIYTCNYIQYIRRYIFVHISIIHTMCKYTYIHTYTQLRQHSSLMRVDTHLQQTSQHLKLFCLSFGQIFLGWYYFPNVSYKGLQLEMQFCHFLVGYLYLCYYCSLQTEMTWQETFKTVYLACSSQLKLSNLIHKSVESNRSTETCLRMLKTNENVGHHYHPLHGVGLLLFPHGTFHTVTQVCSAYDK